MKRCADVGADLVRITVQGMQEAKACGKIRDRLFQDGCGRSCLVHLLCRMAEGGVH